MRFIYTFAVLFLFSSAIAQDKSLFEKQSFDHKNFRLPYRVLYPEGYDANKNYPLVLFLHGAGERGDDNEKQLVHGNKLFLNEENRQKFPAIIVFPQCPKEDYWSNVNITRDESGHRTFNFTSKGKPTEAMGAVMALLDSLMELSVVDNDRIYVGGLSMGGMGTFEIARRKPNVFAAAFPICGGANPGDAKRYAKKVAFWVFHGDKDDIVPPEFSKQMVEAIKRKGGEVKFSLYPEANHNSWDRVFSEPDLLPWIFSKRKDK